MEGVPKLQTSHYLVSSRVIFLHCPSKFQPEGNNTWAIHNSSLPDFVLNGVPRLLLLLSRFSHVQFCVTPIDSSPPGSAVPGILQARTLENGVGCHFLLQCMKVKSESEVAQSCPTPSDPMDCSLPGPSIHGIFQARVLEWGAIAFSKSAKAEITNPFLTWFSQSLDRSLHTCSVPGVLESPSHGIT